MPSTVVTVVSSQPDPPGSGMSPGPHRRMLVGTRVAVVTDAPRGPSMESSLDHGVRVIVLPDAAVPVSFTAAGRGIPTTAGVSVAQAR